MKTTSSTITLQLSYDEIAKEIHAASALRSYFSRIDEQLPPMLLSNHDKALAPIIADACALIALRLADNLADVTLDNEEYAEFVVMPRNISAATALRRALEHAVAAYALHLCFAGVDNTLAADGYRVESDAHIDGVKSSLLRISGTPRVTGW